MNENLIEDIKGLGLNSYEAKVYLALMERDSLSVSEVSKLSKVPRARTYDILDSLVTQGLAALKPGQVKKYSAADPESLRERLLARSERHFVNQKKSIERVTLTLKKKFESKIENERNPLEYIEILKDPYQIKKKFMELVAKSKEKLSFDKPPYLGSSEELNEEFNQQGELLKTGKIKCKNIHEIPKDKEKLRQKFELLDEFDGLSDENRVIAELPMKMEIFDGQIVMLLLEDSISTRGYFTTHVIEHSSLAKSLKMLFNYVWEQAEDYHVLEDLLKKM
jgi:HTH-type transcriptional regulator, sugar sensing transcriptional regulator